MEKIVTKTYLFLEFLNFLNYQEIALIRQICKLFKDKIDNIQIWSQIIQRDYPNIMLLTQLSTTVSLSLFKNKLKNKELTPDVCINIGIFGSMGIFQAELDETANLAKVGFLGSMKEFVCNLGYCRFNLVAFPNVSYGKCQKRLISTFLVLSKCEEGWEKSLKSTIQEVLSIGIRKFVIGLRTNENHPMVEELRTNFKYVVTVQELTRVNVVKMMNSLLSAYGDKDLVNSEEALLNPETLKLIVDNPNPAGEKKKKCLVF